MSKKSKKINDTSADENKPQQIPEVTNPAMVETLVKFIKEKYSAEASLKNIIEIAAYNAILDWEKHKEYLESVRIHAEGPPISEDDAFGDI